MKLVLIERAAEPLYASRIASANSRANCFSTSRLA
jgi:hypothetical protein